MLKAAAEAAIHLGQDRPEDKILIPSEIEIIHQMQNSLEKTDREITSVVKAAKCFLNR